MIGESLEEGDYLLKPESGLMGSIEMFEDYDHFVAEDSFFYANFSSEYRAIFRKKGVLIVISDARFSKI